MQDIKNLEHLYVNLGYNKNPQHMCLSPTVKKQRILW